MRHCVYRATLVLLLFAAGCSDYPMDPNGTTGNVLESGSIRAGIVDGVDMDAARRITSSIASEAGADVTITRAPASLLLRDLEAGELDVVIGDFAGSSPWSRRVIIASPPIADRVPNDEPAIRPALRRGENHWYMLVEQAMKAGAQ